MRFLPLILLVLTGCTNAADPGSDPEVDLVLKTYRVPDGMAESIVSIMNKNFVLQVQNGHRRVAKISTLTNGQVALLAREGIHEGFAELVENLETEPAQPVRNTVIDLWMVVAGEGEPTALLEGAPINDALDVIIEQTGFVNLELMEKMRIMGTTGDRVTVRGSEFSTVVEIGKSADRISLMLEVERFNSTESLRTRLNLEEGKKLVIGESGLRGREGQGRLFYIVEVGTK